RGGEAAEPAAGPDGVEGRGVSQARAAGVPGPGEARSRAVREGGCEPHARRSVGGAARGADGAGAVLRAASPVRGCSPAARGGLSVAWWGLWMALAYLAGSVPFGFLIARARGLDIRQHGSGN